MVILRDEVVMAEYLIWQMPPYQATSKKLNISGSEIRSYFDHRILRPSAVGQTKTLSYTQTDQLAIFRALMADAQAVTVNGATVGSIGIEMDDTQLSGVLRDRQDVGDQLGGYHGYEFPVYGDLLNNLANVDGGFEWRIDSYLDADRNLRRALRLGYPYLGHGPDDDATTLEYPGTVVDYQWPIDGSNSANCVIAVGAGEEVAMLFSIAFASAELASGFPLLERTTSYKSVSVQTTLDTHATADVAALSGDVELPSLTVRGRPDVQPGDYVKVRINDPAWFPDSDVRPMETFLRAVDISTTPGPPETTTITVEAPRTPGEDS